MCHKVIASPLYTILAYERFPRNSLLSDRRETDSCIIPFSSSIVAWPSSPLMSLHLILLLLSLRRMPVIEFSSLHSNLGGFLCGSAGKESACNVGDLGSIPGLGRSPGEGKDPKEWRYLNWLHLQRLYFQIRSHSEVLSGHGLYGEALTQASVVPLFNTEKSKRLLGRVCSKENFRQKFRGRGFSLEGNRLGSPGVQAKTEPARRYFVRLWRFGGYKRTLFSALALGYVKVSIAEFE